MRIYLNEWKPSYGQVLILSLIIGAYWGVFIDLQWNEIVEVGLVYSGVIEAYIPWYVDTFSSQIVLSSLLFKTGISLDVAAIIISASTVALAFVSVSSVVLIFTNIKVVALITPIILCKFPFYNFHYYPVKFPNYNFVFGQIGMYLALTAISLLVLRKSRIAYFLAGILFSIHLIWGAACIVFFILYNFLNKKNRVSKIEFLWFVSSFIISMSTYFYFHHLEIQLHDRQNSYVSSLFNESKSIDQIHINEIDIHKKRGYQIDDKQLMILSADNYESERNKHNFLFSDKRFPLIEGIKFFLPEIGLLFLFYLLSKNKMLESEIRKIFVKVLITLQSMVVLYKLLDEIDPSWTILSWINPSLVGLMMRGLPHRILNLDSIILPSILICLMINLAIAERKLIFRVLFVLILICPFMPNTAGKNLVFSELINLLYPQVIMFSSLFITIYFFLIIGIFRTNEKIT